MNEDLLNLMGSFSETALDCIEKQNEEIEDLKKENTQLKDKLTEIKKIIDDYMPNEHAMSKAFDEIEFIIKEDILIRNILKIESDGKDEVI